MKMDIQKALLFAALIHVLMVNAQIPRLCVNEASITSRECCPIPTIPGSEDTLPCGENHGRGECVDISSMCNQFSPQYNENHVRDNWPHYFTRGCKCNGNFAGYDCGECKFGWKGDDCMEKESESRLSVAGLLDDTEDSERKWNDYKNTLYEAKNTTSTRYVVLTEDVVPGDASTVINSARNITVYDLFVWYHHYVAKENEEKGVCGKVPDYAHEKLGFLTWHRLFLLWFEREIKIELDKPNFTLYYWDWRAGAAIDKLLTQDHFGGIGPNGSIEGNFGDWKPVCWEVKATKNNCNPDASNNVRTTLLRCPKIEQCSSSNSLWPSDEDVNVAVGKDTFDSGPYNALVASGLRNHVEGFKPVSKCPEEKKKPFCDEHCGERLLHNIVHILLGYKGGVMANLAASPNDPLFLNHHTMIDCIFEEWLKKHSSAKYPEDVDSIEDPDVNGYSGHRVDDCIVPFFPLYTHRDMFKNANSFGYSCDLPNINPIPEESTQEPTTAQDNEDDGDAASRIALYSITILLACLAAVLLQ